MRRPYSEEAERWRSHARVEFQDAEDLRIRGRYYLALFHFQQAAEKALKAYLLASARSIEVLHTHAVAELTRMAASIDPDFESIAAAKRLDQYYIPTRYPNGLPGGTPSTFYDDPEEAADAMRLAVGVLDLVDRKLGT